VLGDVVALVDRLAVPPQAEPLDHLEDVVGELGPVALGVGVLDAQDHLAAVLAGVDPVEEDGAGATDVEVAGR
jgi:hypothetical protein